MDCAEVREQFSALLDGELSPEDRAAVEAHLASCASCLRELDGLKRIDGLYRGIRPAVAPAGFEEQVRAAVRGNTIQFRRRRVQAYRLWPLLAAAALFAVVIGTFMVSDVAKEGRFELAEAPKLTQAMKAERNEFMASPVAADEAAESVVPTAKGKARDPLAEPAERESLHRLSPAPAPAPMSLGLEAEEAPATQHEVVESSANALAEGVTAGKDLDMGRAVDEEAADGSGKAAYGVVAEQAPRLRAQEASEPAHVEVASASPAEAYALPEPKPQKITAGYPETLAGPDVAKADSAWQRDINGHVDAGEAERVPVSMEAAPATPSDDLAQLEVKRSGVVGNKDAAVRQAKDSGAAAAQAPHPVEELKALGYLGDAPPKPSPPLLAPAPGECPSPPPARPVHAETPAAPVMAAAPTAPQESAEVRHEAPTEREKTAAGRTFTLRDDSVWIEQGYAGEQVTVLDRDGDVLRELLGDGAEVRAILDVGERIVLRIEGIWYHLKPRATNGALSAGH